MNLSDARIVGIGESRVGKVPDKSTLQLQSDAAYAALDDAGLQLSDIDGLITTPIRTEPWNMPCGVVANFLGIQPAYLSTLDLAGASGCAMIHHAAMAVASGQCHTVLCVAGQNSLTNKSRASAVQTMAESGAAHAQFETPYGPLVASNYALIAQRHMYEFGTTEAQLAEVAVTIRNHALLNPNAHMTKADHGGGCVGLAHDHLAVETLRLRAGVGWRGGGDRDQCRPRT